jgi:hypothetical protein
VPEFGRGNVDWLAVRVAEGNVDGDTPLLDTDADADCVMFAEVEGEADTGEGERVGVTHGDIEVDRLAAMKVEGDTDSDTRLREDDADGDLSGRLSRPNTMLA